jgi:hypothetical protein
VWDDIVYPPIRARFHAIVARPPEQRGDTIELICRDAFVIGYDLCFQNFMDAMLALHAEQEGGRMT